MDAHKLRSRIYKFGMTPEQYFALLDVQENKCALCSVDFAGIKKKQIHVDHDHATGAVRGILCMPCNVALGMLGDTVSGLERALQYLKGVPS